MKMYNFIDIRPPLVLMLCIFFTSCATLMHEPVTTFKVHTTQPAEIQVNRQTLQTVNNVATITTERSRNPVMINVRTDSTERSYRIPATNSFMFYANIFFNYGIGMLVDMNKDKRYTYPSNVYINLKDSTLSFKRYPPVIKHGSTYLQVAIPYINNFYMEPEGESSKSNTGFLGVGLGLDYYYRNGRYISINASIATDHPVPFPVGVDYSGEHESMNAISVTLSNSYRIKKFSIGYGVSFSKNTWKFTYHNRFNPPPPTRSPASKTNNVVGFTLPVQYHFGNKFFLGLNYMPSLFEVSDDWKVHYEHLLSLDMGWKIRLNRHQ